MSHAKSAALVVAATLAVSGAAWGQDPMKMDHATMPGMKSEAGKDVVMGTGTVTAVNPARKVVTLAHDPIKAIDWPAMTMDFPVAGAVDLGTLKPGQKVEFGMTKAGSTYTISSITPRS